MAPRGGDWKAGDSTTPIRRVTSASSQEHLQRACLIDLPSLSSASTQSLSPSTTQQAFCRICLETTAFPAEGADAPWYLPWKAKAGAEEDSKLISPCACTGTQAYVHYTCLRTWQKSVVASSRYNEHANCSAASVCSVCTHRFTVQPPALPLHIRAQRLAEVYARELIWFFLFLCVFYFLLACNLSGIPIVGQFLGAFQGFLGLGPMPAAKEPLSPGTVLVASPTKMSPSSIFYRSVVVLYDKDVKTGGTISGVIVNKPIKKKDLSKARSWDLPLFLDMQGKALPKLLGWGGPLTRSSTMLMDMCPCCLAADPRTPHTQAHPACCKCACQATKELEVTAKGQWARYVFPGLFIGTDSAALHALESTDSPKQPSIECAAVAGTAPDADGPDGTPAAGPNSNNSTKSAEWESVPEEEAAELSESLDDDSEESPAVVATNSSRVVLMGHALWQPGQLEAEIRAGWWLVLLDVQTQDVESMPLKLLWKSLVASHFDQAR